MRLSCIICFLLLAITSMSQRLQTIVPGRPVVIGTAFQVQYVVLDPADLSGFTPPVFENFEIVSGPHHYRGNALLNGRVQPIENITYTLVPGRTGKLPVKGLKVAFKSGVESFSEDAFIDVVAQPAQSFSARSSFTDAVLYGPSTRVNLDQVINENLFIRAVVNKKTCYVGEAITASFKLYSRLQSASELVRVPSLYGFSVIDVLDIREAHQAVETIDGKVFNTSILRQVQLYPEQAGKLVIDEMVLKNEIEFDDSLENDKKTIVHKELRSKPIEILVKALPAKRPDSFSGAVGTFSISSNLDAARKEVNQPARFSVRITGSGNFIQMPEPVITWPAGIESFEPVITDELNTSKIPAEGVRTYLYQVSADSAGRYQVPAVGFSFFDPGKDSFKTIYTEALDLEIIPAPERKKSNVSIPGSSQPLVWPWIVGAVVVSMIIYLVVRRNRKPEPVMEVVEKPLAVSEKCRALNLHAMDDREACIQVNKLLSELHKVNPVITAEQKQELDAIRNECQLLAYSNVEISGKKEELKERITRLSSQIEAGNS